MSGSASEQFPATKSRPTTTSTKATAHSVPPHTRSSGRLPQRAKYSAPATQIDLSNARNGRATAALIRRVLCSQPSGHGFSDQTYQKERATPQPLEELLPPLTSSNEVDLQLYALIAIVMREFVFSWYSKITPDNVFADEVIQVAAHCTRALEQRVRRVDLQALILDEIPSLVESHVLGEETAVTSYNIIMKLGGANLQREPGKLTIWVQLFLAYRTALQSTHASQSKTQFRVVYHTLRPHRALSPVPDVSDPASTSKQKESETIYRQLLAQGTLAVLLPTEDLENVCFRTLVCDILADFLFGEIVSGKVCEGWFLWGTVTKLVSELKTVWAERKTKEGRLRTFDRPAGGNDGAAGSGASHQRQSTLSSLLWRVLQICYLTYVGIRFVVSGLFRVASTPSSSTVTAPKGSVSTSSPAFSMNPAKGALGSTEGGTGRLPVIQYRFFGMLAQLADVPRRMPWLGGLLALTQHQMLTGPGRLGESGGIIDRFLRETIDKHLLVPTLLPTLLLSIRATLFPGNSRPAAIPPHHQPSADSEMTIDTVSHLDHSNRKSGHSSPDSYQQPVASAALPPASRPMSVQPTDFQVQTIKRDCARSIASLIPKRAALTVFGIRGKGGGYSRGAVTSISGGLSQSQPTARADTSSTPSSARLSPAPPGEGSGSGGSDTPKPSAQSQFGPEHQQPQRLVASDDDDYAEAPPSANLHTQRGPRITTSNNNEESDNGETRRDDSSADEQDLRILAAIETDILDLFSDSYCNKHLVFAIIEAVVVKVIPELADHGVAELMADRGL